MDRKVFAEIVVDNKSKKTDKLYTYIVPGDYQGFIKVGMRVLVPFGLSNKLVEGIIIKLKYEVDLEIQNLKKIHSVIDSEPILSEDMIELGLWMRDKYLAKYVDTFHTIIPTGITKKISKIIRLSENLSEEEMLYIKSQQQREIIDFLLENGQTDIDTIKQNLKINNITNAIRSLEDRGIIEIDDNIYSNVNRKFQKFVYRNFEVSQIDLVLNKINNRATKQREIVNYLCNFDYIALKDLLLKTSTNLSTIKTLEEKGIVNIIEKEIKRSPISTDIKRSEKLKLTTLQQECLNSIYNDINNGTQKKFLIHGVTGSGKTEIYLQLIEKMLNLKKGSIVLVPEISLTPQTVERFVSRFGDRVAVLHSRLSLGERYDEWRRIKEGNVQIVVGARSAVFAPFDNLGLIIIDEEHEGSYKSSMNPKYNAIEVAEKRCELEGAVLVLGSATPSIENYYRAKKGEIKLIPLSERVNKKPLPIVEVVDMKKELDNGNKSILSEKLYYAIQENLKNKKQIILFLNRRGFSTFVSCRKCGFVVKCKSCDISLTYHITENILKCHYCGLTAKPPKICPKCGSRYIKYFGIGTQKVEEIIKKAFPNARVVRMDIDTTTRKGSHERIFNTVKRGEVDILIGTQMISKGLDFPNVTLVGIITADISLNLPDYRSSERTFQLTTQVSGRAGRGESEGRVILQTYEPNHYSIETAKEHDYIGFYNKEIMLRKEFKYPPFVNIISIILTSKDEKKLQNASNYVANIINEMFEKKGYKLDKDDLLGPNPAPISKVKGYYRWIILIKCNDDKLEIAKDILRDILSNLNDTYKEIKINIDINPNSIM